MAIARVTANSIMTVNSDPASPHSATWGQTTAVGSLLVAFWAYRTRGSLPSAFNPPAGWTRAQTEPTRVTSETYVGTFYT